MANQPNVYSQGSDGWETYMAGRPRVPESFFTRIYDYHASKGGKFHTVHDAGAGAGVHSARLAQRFEKVIVTDRSEENISVAQTRLSSPQYNIRALTLEESIELPAASVDLVFAAAMLHFTEVPRALEAVAHQLRSGGTFMAAGIGLCRFMDAAVQKALEGVFHVRCRQIVPKDGSAIRPAIVVLGSGYDSVELSPELFEADSIRLKLNDPASDILGGQHYATLMAPELRDRYPMKSAVASTEKVVHEVDEDWAFKWDVSAVMRYLDTFPFDLKDEDMQRKIQALKDAVGDRTVEGCWVVSAIMATRK